MFWYAVLSAVGHCVLLMNVKGLLFLVVDGMLIKCLKEIIVLKGNE